MNSCDHQSLECLNPFEIIRKYRCNVCGSVMMCVCDEAFGRRVLPHQLREGCELKSQRRIPVTVGFIPRTCKACRGLPEDAHPKAEMFGATSKVLRYYWREIYMRSAELFADWAEARGFDDIVMAQIEHTDVFQTFEKGVIEEIKKEHQQNPKYCYDTQSAEEVLIENQVETIRLDAEYAANEEKGRSRIMFNGETCSAEEFAAAHFRSQGFTALDLESTPFHVIFAVYLWPLIQSPLDPLSRMTSFGDRVAFENKETGRQIWMYLPNDFGSVGFAERRALAIEEHFYQLPDNKAEWLQLFDLWVEPSSDLRQYLWAHNVDDLVRARKVVEVLSSDILAKILRYLVGNYWGRYIGWPDLLLFRANEILLVEVKSSGDKLRENQKDWIRDNSSILNLPFKIVKIHRKKQSAH